jgi:hypothetical protein
MSCEIGYVLRSRRYLLSAVSSVLSLESALRRRTPYPRYSTVLYSSYKFHQLRVAAGISSFLSLSISSFSHFCIFYMVPLSLQAHWLAHSEAQRINEPKSRVRESNSLSVSKTVLKTIV